ncbi:hypothetical protein ACQWHJ_26405, partial [Salmonella enterica subsp. enterica serovar Infantis]
QPLKKSPKYPPNKKKHKNHNSTPHVNKKMSVKKITPPAKKPKKKPNPIKKNYPPCRKNALKSKPNKLI